MAQPQAVHQVVQMAGDLEEAVSPCRAVLLAGLEEEGIPSQVDLLVALKVEVLLVVGNPFQAAREGALTQGGQKEVVLGEGRHRGLQEGELPLLQPREGQHQAAHAAEGLEVVRLGDRLGVLLLLAGLMGAPLGVEDLSAALRLQGDLQVDQVGLMHTKTQRNQNAFPQKIIEL